MRVTPATPAHLRSQRIAVLERRLSELAGSGQGMSAEEVAFQARALRGILDTVAIRPDEREAVDGVLAQWERSVGSNLTTWSTPIAAVRGRLGVVSVEGGDGV